MSGTISQLSFALDNETADATVYISTSPSDNTLSLVITSNVGCAFTPGAVVPIDDAEQAAGSLLYVDFTQLGMTEAEFNALTLDDGDWNFVLYYSSYSQLIGFSPTASKSLSPTGSLNLSLNNFTLASAPATPTVQLSAAYFRVDGVNQGNLPLWDNFSVAVSYPPESNDQDIQSAIVASLSPDGVVNCPADGEPLENTLTLVFSPGPKPSVIKAAEDTQFTLSFVYAEDANGFGALMTPDQAGAPDFAVTAGQNASQWVITPHTGAQSPYWILTPPVDQPIIGTGAASTVSFTIAGLVTNFQPGPTTVLVAYRNVPGCADGTYTILLEKFPRVEVDSFTATPAQSALVNKAATVTVSWTASYATELTLYLTGPDQQATARVATTATTKTMAATTASNSIVDVTGKTSYTATIGASTEFVLEAVGRSPDNAVNNRTIVSCLATITPVIDSFTVSPEYIQSGKANSCKLSWSVNAPSDTDVTLASSLTGPDGLTHTLVGSQTLSITDPQQFTLTATPDCGFPVVSQTVDVHMIPVINSFQIAPTTLTLASPNSYTASWQIAADSAVDVTLTGSVNGRIASGLALSGSKQIQLLRPQVVTLAAAAPNGPTAQAAITMNVPNLLYTNYTPSITDSSNQTPGQQVTTPAGGPWTNIIFNFFNTANGNPYALGNLYLLTQPYTGTPSSLSNSAKGFVAVASATNNQWVFASNVTLQGNTSYYFFMSSHPPQGTAATYNKPTTGFSYYGSANGKDPFAYVKSWLMQFALYGK